VGAALNRQGHFREAQVEFEEAINITGAARYQVAEAKSLLGESLAGQQAFVRAEPWVLAGYEELTGEPMATMSLKREAAARIDALYEAEKAKEWRAKLEAANTAAGQPKK
jgi:hypothetical protein